MRAGLELTLKTLSRSTHARAVDVLETALDSPDEDVRTGAAEMLLRRASLRSHSGYVRWLVRQPADERNPPRGTDEYGAALDACLLRGAPEDRRAALELAAAHAECGRIPAVLVVAEDSDEELAAFARRTVTDLVETLRRTREDVERGLADGQTACACRDDIGHALGALLRVIRRRDAQPIHELAARSILLLGTPKCPEVRELLWTAEPPIREIAAELLRHDDHPGVLAFVLRMLGTDYPHPTVFEALREREDRPFVEALLRHLSGPLTPTFHRNLHQVEDVRWLRADYVAELPDDLQAACVRLVEKTHFEESTRDAFLDWVVRHGSGEARRLASDRLARLDAVELAAIVNEGLDDEDVDVQVWATSQLRSPSIPNGIRLLVQRLQSDLEPVREAARRELRDFDLATLLEVYDRLSPRRALAAGRLVELVDPDVGSKLDQELRHPHHRRRLNAIRATARLGLGRTVIPTLLAASEDADPLVRRVVAECLGAVPEEEVVNTLHCMRGDVSPRVREAVESSLARLANVSARRVPTEVTA